MKSYWVTHTLCAVMLFCTEALPESRLKTIRPQTFKVLQQIHGYEKELPLEPMITRSKQWDRADATLERIVFTTFDGTRVPLVMLYPNERAKPVPCVLLLHGLSGNKEQWFSAEPGSRDEYPIRLVKAGIAVAAIDARNHGDRNYQLRHKSPLVLLRKKMAYTYQRMAISTVIDYRRLMDYLETRKEFDRERIGAVGYSMGGMFTFELAAIDDRIKTAVACAPPTTDWDWAVGHHYFAPYVRKCHFRILMGRDDPFTTASEARELHSLLGTKHKDIIFYDSGHRLPDDATNDALTWLIANLN